MATLKQAHEVWVRKGSIQGKNNSGHTDPRKSWEERYRRKNAQRASRASQRGK